MMRKSLESLKITLPRGPEDGWRTRFAPSPTGFLHLGHIASALWVWLCGRKIGAQIDLRIEDHDLGRCRPQFEQAILEDLSWLGLMPDRGLLRSGQLDPDFRQSSHRQRYDSRMDELRQRQLIFACDCSRKQIAAMQLSQESELHYPGTCRNRGVEFSRQVGIRFRLETEEVAFQDGVLGKEIRQNPNRQCGDLLLQERSGSLTYQYCVVVDDLNDGINLIVRGSDLLESTGRQIMLARALGRITQPHFAHHPLLTNADGQKLSKRDRAESIGAMRSNGVTKEMLFGQVAFLLGLQEESIPRALDEFTVDVSEVNTSS
jgi:glutamyl-Q tRNA(Asp) synthetase